MYCTCSIVFFQAEDGIRDLVRSRGLGDVYKRQEKEQFGKGSIDGLMAAETGDMASIPGHIIPCLALGIPGSAPVSYTHLTLPTSDLV